MKKFITRLLLFTLFLIVFYSISIILWSYFPSEVKPNLNYKIGSSGHMYTRLNEVKNYKEKVDVLFLGSSHSYRGFDNRNFSNIVTFNLGSSAQTPLQTELLFNRYIDVLKPKTIVYEVYPETFCSDGVESSLNLIANSKNDLSTIKMALKTNHIKVYNTLLYGFISDFFSLNSTFSEPLIKGDDRYISGGYVEKKMSYFKHVHYPKTNKWNFNDKQIAAFSRIASKIKQKNINLVLVYAPITPALYSSYINNDSFNKLMISYNAKYYNFNTILKLDDSKYFYDSNHLNQAGVNLFNRKLKDIINIDSL